MQPGAFLMEWSTFWTALGAFATLAAVLSILVAARQLRFEAWLRAQEIFVDPKFVEARGRVFSHLKPPPRDWDAKDQEAGFEVCRRIDDFCRLAPYLSFTKSRGRQTVLQVWGDPLGKAWGLLSPLVVAERNFVDWQTKWDAFEILGNAALERFSEKRRIELTKIAERLGPQMTQLRNS